MMREPNTVPIPAPMNGQKKLISIQQKLKKFKEKKCKRLKKKKLG